MALDHIREVFDKLNFGFDNSKGEDGWVAYCDIDNNINVDNSFWDLSRETQIAVLIHEMNHAISQNNEFNNTVDASYSDVNYLSSYKIIEEGLADVNAELIMNYYYDNSGVDIPDHKKFRNFTENSCGYPIDRKILKTLLLMMQIADVDKAMLFKYYFRSKKDFFDMLRIVGGDNAFEMIVVSQEIGRNSKDQRIADEYFRSLEETFSDEMDLRDFSSGGYYASNFENVYMKENDLADALRISYFASKMLKSFDIKNIDKAMIDEIYIKTNGLISQISFNSIGYVSGIIDELICNWIDNCDSIDDFKYINKIVPNVLELYNCRYIYLLFRKKLNIGLGNIKPNEVDTVMANIDKLLGAHADNINDEEMGAIYSDNTAMFSILKRIYNLASKEQLKKFNLYQGLFRGEKVLLSIYKLLGDDLVLTQEKLKRIINDKDLCRDVSTYVDLDTKKTMIKTYLENCSFKKVFSIETLFPDVWTMDDGVFWDFAVALGKIRYGDKFKKRK